MLTFFIVTTNIRLAASRRQQMRKSYRLQPKKRLFFASVPLTMSVHLWISDLPLVLSLTAALLKGSAAV